MKDNCLPQRGKRGYSRGIAEGYSEDRWKQLYKTNERGPFDPCPWEASIDYLGDFPCDDPPEPPLPLEEFEGFVEQIDGDVAFVTLKDKSGETLYGEYPASELEALGIREHRRFSCRTFDAGGGNVKIELAAVPDRRVSNERQRAIGEELRRELGDDDGPKDDY